MNEAGRPQKPFFSLVVPMYNRERLIGRLLASCLSQEFSDFEVIVVDDKSTDGSIEAVQRYLDPRISLVCQPVNRGVCPARNTGVAAARGEWIFLIDSDDELLPGALNTVRQRIAESTSDAERLVFMYRLDTGGFSPNPPLHAKTWNYEGYLRWTNALRKTSDFCNVIRRRAFEAVQYPNDRALESKFHLDFTRRFLTECCPDVIGVIHSDANNRSLDTAAAPSKEHALDNAVALSALLECHGEALQRWAPVRYEQQMMGLATLFFQAGLRWGGLKQAACVLRHRPLALPMWVRIVAGLCGPSFIARLKTIRRLFKVWNMGECVDAEFLGGEPTGACSK